MSVGQQVIDPPKTGWFQIQTGGSTLDGYFNALYHPWLSNVYIHTHIYIYIIHILHSHSRTNTDEKGMCPGWPAWGVVGCSAACWVVPWATATGISAAVKRDPAHHWWGVGCRRGGCDVLWQRWHFRIPSGKQTKNQGKSQFLMGKLTISTGPFSIANC